MEGEKKKVGIIAHYYNKIAVAIVDLEDTLNKGDTIEIAGPTTHIQMTVESMQIEHEDVPSAKKGQSIGLKVPEPTREKDVVYKLM